MEALFDLMIKEQLLNCLSEDVRVWVRERKPKNSEEYKERILYSQQPSTDLRSPSHLVAAVGSGGRGVASY